MTKGLSPDETAKVLVETISILNAVTSTTDLLHNALMRFRERKVRFIVGDATVPDAETDRVFDEVCEILRLMGESIPQRIASALLEGEATVFSHAEILPDISRGENTITSKLINTLRR